MATEANFNKPDDDPNAPQTSGTVAPQSDAGATQASSAVHNSTPSGTPNIQSYLRANQGAGQQLSQGIGNNFQKQTDQFNQQVQSNTNQLKSQANPLEQNLGQNAQGQIQTAFKDPNSLLNQQDQLNQFKQLRDQGYQGDINNLQNNAGQQQAQMQSQLGGLQQQAQNANSESGRFQLLRNTFNQPQYSQGQQKLDQLFLQAQPGATQQLQQNLNSLGTQAGQNLNQATSDVQSKLNALNNMSAQDSQQIKDLFTNGSATIDGQTYQGLSGIGQNVANEYNQTKDNAAATNIDLQNAITTNKFSPDQLQKLGLADSTRAWGVKLDPYFSTNVLNDADKGGNAQVASADEFARYNALNQLAGNGTPSIFGNATAVNPYTANSFRKDDFQNAVADRQKAITQTDYNSQISQMINQLGQIGHIGKGSIAPWDLAAALQSAQNSGNLDASRANSMLQNYMPALQDMGTGLGDSVGATRDFSNYYNTEYAPAYGDVLGTPEGQTAVLPNNPNGSVNWGAIPAPKGK